MSGRPVPVVHIITRLDLGGAQQNTLHTVTHLDRARFEPRLYAGAGGLLDPAAAASCPVVFLRSLRRPIRPWWDLVALARLWALLRRERPVIVHTHSSKAGVLGRAAAALAGVPFIVHTYHGFGFNPEQRPWTRGLFVLLERLLAPFTSRLIVVSEANRAEALARGIGRPQQFALIRSGVALDLYRSLDRRREAPSGLPFLAHERVITTVGPFKPQKNLVDFLRAAGAVAARRPEARFLLVGDGAGRPALEREIERLGLGGRVVLAGWRRDMPAIMARTDVFCLTSLWEGLPRALVEAMAAGRPSVVNAVDGCRDLVQDGVNGFLTPPHHPFATADRILRLLADEAMARRMGDRARASVSAEFDLDGMVRQQESLYASLVAGDGASDPPVPGSPGTPPPPG